MFSKMVKKSNDDNVMNDKTIEYLSNFNKNCIFSVYGFYCALDVLKNGSSGKVSKEIDDLKIDKNILDLIKTDDFFLNTTMLLLHNEYNINSKYSEYLKKYDVTLGSIDMNKLEKEIKNLNTSISRSTDNNLRDVLSPKSFDDLFRFIVINILYFKNEWERKFSIKNTKKLPFYNDINNEEIFMMTQYGSSYYYYENQDHQFISLPYSTYPYKMIIALPKKQNAINNPNLSDAIKNMDEYEIEELVIPKFSIELEQNLIEQCELMGATSMFKASSDFDKIIDDKDQLIYIQEFKQKSFINVDENGTSAGSVTFAIGRNDSCMPPKYKGKANFIANRPFSYFVMKNNTIIFAGKFYNY